MKHSRSVSRHMGNGLSFISPASWNSMASVCVSLFILHKKLGRVERASLKKKRGSEAIFGHESLVS